jgi:hypothetical protein
MQYLLSLLLIITLINFSFFSSGSPREVQVGSGQITIFGKSCNIIHLETIILLFGKYFRIIELFEYHVCLETRNTK